VQPPALTMQRVRARATTPRAISYRDGRSVRSARAAANSEVVDHLRRPADAAGEVLGLTPCVGRLRHPAQGDRPPACADDDPSRAHVLSGLEGRSHGRGDDQVVPRHPGVDLHSPRPSLRPDVRNAARVPPGVLDDPERLALSGRRVEDLERNDHANHRASYPCAVHRSPDPRHPATLELDVGVHRGREDVNEPARNPLEAPRGLAQDSRAQLPQEGRILPPIAGGNYDAC